MPYSPHSDYEFWDDIRIAEPSPTSSVFAHESSPLLEPAQPGCFAVCWSKLCTWLRRLCCCGKRA